MTATRITAAYAAAFDALRPYTKHAQVRAHLAETIVTTLQAYSPFVAVEVLGTTWPRGVTRINRKALTEIVQTAADALKEG